MDAMRDLGSFGDERLKKGVRISSPRWWVGGRRASGGWVAGEVARFDLAGSCITLRSRPRK
jgi:hypothetical protein